MGIVDSTAEPPPQRSAARFPFASLALMITTCACLLASADIKRWQNLDLMSWDTTLAVNLTAPWLLVQNVLPGRPFLFKLQVRTLDV